MNVSFDQMTAVYPPDLKLRAEPRDATGLCYGCAIYEKRLFRNPRSTCRACGSDGSARKDGKYIRWMEAPHG